MGWSTTGWSYASQWAGAQQGGPMLTRIDVTNAGKVQIRVTSSNPHTAAVVTESHRKSCGASSYDLGTSTI